VPPVLSNEIRRWGLPKDEYVRTDHWSHQLYIREARRMVGEYVATQADCEGRTEIMDGVGFAAYGMDSHNCERIVIEKGGKKMVKNEGNVEIGVSGPYPVSYRSLTPRREECTNLLVPVCVSASHIAYGSIRMEPVFMGLGQSSGLAAAFAGKGAVQDVDVKRIQDIYAHDPYLDGREPDVLLDEDSPYITGREGWETVKSWGAYGKTYLRYSGAAQDNHLKYEIPTHLHGLYDIYAFQYRGGCPETTYMIQVGRRVVPVVFSRKDFVIEGQAAGEWLHLGSFKLRRNRGGTIRVSGDAPDLRADAVLLIKKTAR